ncbi:transposase [Streptomyces barringtoniae]|uniref:transposase n=1 Tax=Streptomyces barringtoniae TaxID=2892029 RepID=UPI001E580B43|nr:transposase [Streptomyces barringtoniae]MCC5481262.1 transposase [Streptomyces barringtoniae]
MWAEVGRPQPDQLAHALQVFRHQTPDRAIRTGSQVVQEGSPCRGAAVLGTTRYLDAAVDHLRALLPEEREHDVLDDDVARVSPLKHADLNCLGRYSFAARPPREGRLRSLHDPATVHLDEDDEGTGERRGVRARIGP